MFFGRNGVRDSTERALSQRRAALYQLAGINSFRPASSRGFQGLKSSLHLVRSWFCLLDGQAQFGEV